MILIGKHGHLTGSIGSLYLSGPHSTHERAVAVLSPVGEHDTGVCLRMSAAEYMRIREGLISAVIGALRPDEPEVHNVGVAIRRVLVHMVDIVPVLTHFCDDTKCSESFAQSAVRADPVRCSIVEMLPSGVL